MSAPHPLFVVCPHAHSTVEHQGATSLNESSESEARRRNGHNEHRVSQETSLSTLSEPGWNTNILTKRHAQTLIYSNTNSNKHFSFRIF